MAEKPDYIGHRKRIKEKYKDSGLKGWLDYEVLELALSYAVPRKDTKPVARELLKKFKSINGVLDAGVVELQSINGISEHAALFMKLLKDISKLYLEAVLSGKDLIDSPEAVINYLKTTLRGSKDEEFHALFLNSANRLLAAETIQKGTVNKSVVFPRKIVEQALSNHAVGVIVAHNHPGETLKPSSDDIRVTRAIADALQTVDVSLLDHIIIGGNGYFSWRENRLL